MPDTTTITAQIEKARKVLQYEQRNTHQDKLVKGGLELFASRWAEEFQSARQQAGLDIRPIYRLMEHLEGYHQQDPLQRATNLRAVLAILDTLEQDGANGQAATPNPANNGASVARSAHDTRTAPQGNGNIAPDQANISGKHAQTSPEAVTGNGATSRGPRKSTQTSPKLAPTPPDLRKAMQKMGEEQAQTENPIRLDRAMSAGHTSLALLTADVTAVPGVGPSVAARLRALGIRTIRDLLFY
ncbi:MAG: hypothetical protein ACRDHW_20380, partial [Ktedonobacteraceae bacterium]